MTKTFNDLSEGQKETTKRLVEIIKVGRPTKYRPEFLEEIIANGFNLGWQSDLYLLFGIHKDTFNDWKHNNQSVKEACEFREAAARSIAGGILVDWYKGTNGGKHPAILEIFLKRAFPGKYNKDLDYLGKLKEANIRHSEGEITEEQWLTTVNALTSSIECSMAPLKEELEGIIYKIKEEHKNGSTNSGTD